VDVPEPELAVVVSADRLPLAVTIGNDVPSRDIEGANPLDLPQAKIYHGACALGPRCSCRWIGARPTRSSCG
jgi:2-dehydro-3-deoxy-D-arabinonate dehydratase